MIDRESDDARNGAFILEITAQEEGNTDGSVPSISTEVTIIIEVSLYSNIQKLLSLTLLTNWTLLI